MIGTGLSGIHILISAFVLLCVNVHCAVAESRAESRDQTPKSVAEEFKYRKLASSDFRATSAPDELSSHGQNLDAASCLRIAWPDGLEIGFMEMSATAVTAKLESPIFHAAFESGCSWLKRELSDLNYVLLHEQIHFAITESAARELTSEMHGRSVRGRSNTRAGAVADLMTEMRRLANQANRRAKPVHREFDDQTQRDTGKVLQAKWARRLEPLLDLK